MRADQAFPGVRPDRQHAGGMSLRDWFAGLAMQGAIARSRVSTKPPENIPATAAEAYAIADAMLKEGGYR